MSKYTLNLPRAPLNRDTLLRSVTACGLAKPSGRWRAYLTAKNATMGAPDPDGWLWGYGLACALRGLPQPHPSGSQASEGWAAGAKALADVGRPAELDLDEQGRRYLGRPTPPRRHVVACRYE